MRKKFVMKDFPQSRIALPAVIFLLILLAFGLLIPSIGFYWDDWPFAWLLRFFGPSDFIEAFRPFRPFLGPIFAVTTSIFGGNPLTWQLVGLGVRFLLSLVLWLVLRLVWPAQKLNLIWVVLLFTVYPGYQQQWVALTHVNQELIPLLWLLASFGVTISAVRNEHDRKGLTILALLLQVLGLFSTEYFFGLEILRFLFIIIVFSESLTSNKLILKRAGWIWSPYLGIWLLNAAWTYTFHNSAVYSSYNINISPSLSPLAVINEIITTFSLAGFTSWLNTFQILARIDGTLNNTASLAVLVVTVTALYLFGRSVHNQSVDRTSINNDAWGFQAALIGLIGIFAGRLPSWAAGLPLKLEFDYDRFMLSIMLGASLFIIGFATLVFQEGTRKIFILSLLVGLAASYQFSVSNTFRRDWENQQKFFWELTWRMPALEKGTILLTHELPLKYVSDMQVTAPINWMYNPDQTDREIHYLLLYIKSRLRSPTLPSLQPDTPIEVQYRTTHFESSTSNSVVIFKDADGCLRVLDPVYGSRDTVPGANDFLRDAIRLSDPDRIKVAPQPALNPTFFGSEPAHAWCYFYAKAELARQGSDWEMVANLYEQAGKNGFGPSQQVENLPFIEGYALIGQTDMALKLTEATLKQREDLCPAVRSLWDRVMQSSASDGIDEIQINDRIRQSGCRE